MLHRRNRLPLVPALMVSLFLAVGLAACGSSTGGGGLYGTGGGSNSGATGTTPPAATTKCDSSSAAICTRSVQVNGNPDTVLVTPDGKTLYYFTADTATSTACLTSCLGNWKPLISASAKVDAIPSLTGALNTLSRSEGMQVEFNGHPLYTFVADTAPGDVKGNGILGKWFIATPALQSGGYSSGY